MIVMTPFVEVVPKKWSLRGNTAPTAVIGIKKTWPKKKLTSLLLTETVKRMPLTTDNGTQKFEALHRTDPFTFTVADENIATMSEDGVLTAKADGETTVTVKNAKGQTTESLKIRVGKKSGGDNGGGSYPIGDQSTCDAICQIIPNLPWCK